MRAPVAVATARGGPLIMIGLVLTAWTGARAVWWENPLAGLAAAVAAPTGLPLALAPRGAAPGGSAPGAPGALASAPAAMLPPATAARAAPIPDTARRGGGMLALLSSGFSSGIDPRIAAAQQYLWQAALRTPLAYPATSGTAATGFLSARDRLAARDPAPFLPAPAPGTATSGGRWSLDGWAFWRQGSDSAPVSQGRVPIYGASQIGLVLNYRLAPTARRDPRLYLRGYRALVRRGETELALGAAARPLPRLPLRVAAELRITDSAFGTQIRPSAYAVTELAPLRLPLGAHFEAYGQAGWVGGAAATPFAEGQVGVTRELGAVADATDNRLRLSLGAGAWAGAQNDAQRIDLGPTMRLDVTLGEVPARVSLDWRERVGGDAAPGSGLAATLSTRF